MELDKDFVRLIDAASNTLNPRELSECSSCGYVSSAIMMESGKIYVGINIDTPCSMGHCAEVSALSSALTHSESRIIKMVTLSHIGRIMPPCGRCREFIYQVDKRNLKTQVLLENGPVELEKLLPELWN